MAFRLKLRSGFSKGAKAAGAAGDLIGTAGDLGFGVGVASVLPSGMTALSGYDDPSSENYGNYQFADGSIMVYVPKFYYKVGTGSNGLDVNVVDVKGLDTYATTAVANAAGYALHRAFIDGGSEYQGFFFDKYQASKNAKGAGFVASSIKNGLPISTSSVHNPIADLTAVTTNQYWSAIIAAHARDGVDGAVNASSIFHLGSMYQYGALAMLSLAHGQASSDATNCAWFDATYNFPKGNNNDALADANDTAVKWESDGYANCGKTGSAGYGGGAGNVFAKSTHNGQNSGIADLNGNMYELGLGMTAVISTPAIGGMSQANPCVVTVTGHGLTTGDPVQFNSIAQADWIAAKDKIFTATVVDPDTFSINFNASAFATPYDAGTDAGTVSIGSFYAAKQATRMADFTSGNSAATDNFGATGVAAMMDEIDFQFVDGGVFAQKLGNGANQVLSEAVSGSGYVNTGLALPASGSGLSSDGTNLFGTDFYYQYLRNELFPTLGGSWSVASNAGVFARIWSNRRTFSDFYVGFRLATYG